LQLDHGSDDTSAHAVRRMDLRSDRGRTWRMVPGGSAPDARPDRLGRRRGPDAAVPPVDRVPDAAIPCGRYHGRPAGRAILKVQLLRNERTTGLRWRPVAEAAGPPRWGSLPRAARPAGREAW